MASVSQAKQIYKMHNNACIFARSLQNCSNALVDYFNVLNVSVLTVACAVLLKSACLFVSSVLSVLFYRPCFLIQINK